MQAFWIELNRDRHKLVVNLEQHALESDRPNFPKQKEEPLPMLNNSLP